MCLTSVQIWDAIYRLGADDLIADGIPPAVVAKLVEFKMVECSDTALPKLTPYGERCLTVLISGKGVVPELNEMAALELKASRRKNGRAP